MYAKLIFESSKTRTGPDADDRVLVEKERVKAEKAKKFAEKQAKLAAQTSMATSKTSEKKSKGKSEEQPPVYVEETPKGQKKSECFEGIRMNWGDADF